MVIRRIIMKKNILSFLIFFLSFVFINSATINAKTSKPPSVSADGAILMDAQTGKILYEKNINKPYPPASTTKIMTALLTLENCNLDDEVTVGKKPPLADGSKIFIHEGEKLKVKDLLYALLLESANDAAEALAEHISGSIEDFSKLMNKRAKELGCTNTNFINPNGLYHAKHRTTAQDLALIMKEVSQYEDYRKISNTITYKIKPTNKSKKERPLWNKNKLVQQNSKYYFKGCNGGKTGYTTQSQHSYVVSANRGDFKLIAVLIHDSKKTFFEDSVNLLNYGFNNFELIKMYSRGDIVTEYNEKDLSLNLIARDDLYYIKEKINPSKAILNLEKKNLNSISFHKGDTILNAQVLLNNNNNVGTLNLSSDRNHETSIFKMNSENKLIFFTIFVVFFLIFMISIIRFRKKLKRKKQQRKYFY
ncbi:D-alanyl-D-alanine carboxypeptidase [Clostridium tetani]|uniref:serine-type D-Ala-D-Ala carboxypeptidase n=2 Tax=Clostridium tetani TaxID=1513 RepID=A0ABY0EQG3_CLOTA|nr:D-alanyl-D-alanine carboxypeptidase [Clostridium tetani]